MWRFVILGSFALVIVIVGFSLADMNGGEAITASTLLTASDADISGFRRAIGPWVWQFPQDYGAHPDFQTEWWYYTGNLADEDGRRFGYQFTIFRRAITPAAVESDSEWRVSQVYMAHFTLTDVAGNAFYHHQRLSRGGAGLAGATTDPRFRVWLEDWQVVAADDAAYHTAITANADDVAIAFDLEQVKTPALQGDNGLSRKDDAPGNASYYYSLSRLLTEGTITIGGQTYTVSGTSWMDHEFSTSALGDDARGWDWFGLHLDDNRDLMLGQIRLVGGDKEPVFGGLLINADGSTRRLDAEDFTIETTGSWSSPHTGAVYPAGWTMRIDLGDDTLTLKLDPLISDQELTGGSVAYWEGAVRISGDVSGYGYAELTGYADTMTGRF